MQHARRERAVAFFMLLSGSIAGMGCARHADVSDDRKGGGTAGATVGGAVVSTVDGVPVTVAEVQALVSASALGPRDALRRLQAERLLMAEAKRRGMSSRPGVVVVARQARVQALLRAEAGAAQISEPALRKAYADAGARFERPELRSCVHLLAKLPKHASAGDVAAAKAFAQAGIAELGGADDLDAVLRAENGRQTDAFTVVAETLPRQTRGSNIEKPFLDAVFALTEPGVVPEPVRTSYGWHAIRVTEIVASHAIAFETVADGLRKELIEAAREKRVKDLVAELTRQQRIVVPPGAAGLLDVVPL